RWAVGEIDLFERKALLRAQDVQPRRLQRRIVIIVEIVEADHGAAFGEQPASNVEADETRSSGDQYCLTRHRILGRHLSKALKIPIRASLPALPTPPQHLAAPLLPDRPENHTKAPNCIAFCTPFSNPAWARCAVSCFRR